MDYRSKDNSVRHVYIMKNGPDAHKNGLHECDSNRILFILYLFMVICVLLIYLLMIQTVCSVFHGFSLDQEDPSDLNIITVFNKYNFHPHLKINMCYDS